MSHGRNPGYEPGNHWVVCDVCGFDYRVDKIKERWDGLMVCPKDYELRHPQDFVRSTEEDSSAKGPVRTPPEPEFVDWECETLTPVVGEAIAGCSIAGYEPLSVPTGTFGDGL